MIWDYIRDFLVQYIFGGVTSEGDYYNAFYSDTFSSLNEITIVNNSNEFYLLWGDYLSSTFTIIIMCMIVVFAIWLVRWVYKTVVSAFLLK